MFGLSTELIAKGLVKKYRVGRAGAFGNVVDKKRMAHPLPFGTKLTNPPLNEGWKLHDPPPIKHEFFWLQRNPRKS